MSESSERNSVFDWPLSLPPEQCAALQAAYAEPPRAYHNWTHVQDVLRHYREIDALVHWHRPKEVWLAALYHDAIYLAGRKDNEVRSAQLAIEHIQRWLEAQDIDYGRVRELILATARHGMHGPEAFGSGPQAEDTCRFLDCDMAILAAPTEQFDAYDRGIAAEYAQVVPNIAYRWRRRRFLQQLLDNPRIYLSPQAHMRWDAAARANLRRALDRSA